VLPDPLLNPVILPEVRVAVHAKVAPATAEVIPMEVVVPEHICVGERAKITTGVGFTWTIKSVEGPSQPRAAGVTV